jgi:hypothetical protein
MTEPTAPRVPPAQDTGLTVVCFYLRNRQLSPRVRVFIDYDTSIRAGLIDGATCQAYLAAFALRASAIAISNSAMVRIPGTRNLPTMKDGVPRKPNACA